jgi:hypothetical protein
MTRRVFFIFFLFILHFTACARGTSNLQLTARVYSSLSVTGVVVGAGNSESSASNARIKTNMPIGSYIVYEDQGSSRNQYKKEKGYRKMIVEVK